MMSHKLPTDIRIMNGVANALLVLCALALVGGFGRWLLQHPAWRVGVVEVRGDVQHQTAATFRTAIEPELGKSFLTLDLQAIKARFTELAWVRDVVIRREWPNRLLVRVDEHQPVAWWGAAQEDRMLNSHGQVFEAQLSSSASDAWPVLQGPVSRASEVYSLYLMFKVDVEQAGLQLLRVELTPQAQWRLTLGDDVSIELGQGSAPVLQSRLQAFLASLPEITQRYGSALSSADLRYPNGYAVRFDNVKTLALPPKAKPSNQH